MSLHLELQFYIYIKKQSQNMGREEALRRKCTTTSLCSTVSNPSSYCSIYNDLLPK